jgi:hypothetical protein
MSLHFGDALGANRYEHLRFKLSLDKTQAENHADDVRTVLGKDLPAIIDGDTFNVNYELSVLYFGGVVERLSAISRLLDVPGLTRRVDLDELNHSRSIFVEIVRQVDAVKAKLASNNGSNNGS